MSPASKTFFFKKSHFVTHLPVDYRYTRSHYWAEQRENGRLRLGFTKFATRMLGEIVDYNFEIAAQTALQPGQVLGWVEGFKAISDVICVGQGVFAGGNAALQQDTELISREPYNEGWLYEMDGHLDDQSLDVQGYAHHLEVTIDKILQEQHADEETSRAAGSD
jgi:glycine cleavage system H protein